MTLSYQEIMDTDLSSLKSASTAWQSMSKRFGDLKTDYDTNVRNVVDTDDWKGEAKTAYLKGSKITQHEYKAAQAEAKAISSLLGDAYEQLHRLKEKLQSKVQKAEESGFSVNPHSGRATVDWSKKSSAETRALKQTPDVYTGEEEEWSRQITRIVEEINDADEGIKNALRTAVQDSDGKGKSDGFNGNAETDLRKSRVNEAVDLAKKGDEISNPQLTRLNALLERNGNDKKFAESFATRMSPKGTMEFWSGLAPYTNAGKVQPQRQKILAETRKQLGKTLGAATRSTSPEMDRWRKEIRKISSDRFGDEGDRSPYGYQVMSDLIRHGNYNDDFLHKYGDELIKFEKKFESPEDVWLGLPHQLDTFLGDTDNAWRTDPMAGLMAGLSHNPEASTEFFSDPATFNYVVGGGEEEPGYQKDGPGDEIPSREWPEAMLPGQPDPQKGTDSLGHALEAAVTNVPRGDPSPHLVRGPEQVEVMHKVIDAYGGPYNPMDEQPGINDSLGRMGASYIDYLNYGLEATVDDPTGLGTDKLLGADGPLDISKEQASGFMATIGREEKSYKIASKAQEALIAGQMNGVSNSEDIYRLGEIGARGHGALDEARGAHIENTYKEAEEQKKEALREAAAWKKGTASVVIYGTAGALGAASPGGILLPTLFGGGSAGIVSGVNEAITNAVAPESFDNSNESIDSVKNFSLQAKANASKLVQDWMTDEGIDKYKRAQIDSRLTTAYNDGQNSVYHE